MSEIDSLLDRIREYKSKYGNYYQNEALEKPVLNEISAFIQECSRTLKDEMIRTDLEVVNNMIVYNDFQGATNFLYESLLKVESNIDWGMYDHLREDEEDDDDDEEEDEFDMR